MSAEPALAAALEDADASVREASSNALHLIVLDVLKGEEGAMSERGE